MDHDDVLRVEDVAQVRAMVVKARRRVLFAASVTPILSAVLVGLLANLKLHSFAASSFVGAVFLLIGVPIFVHCWRHYRSILSQLDAVARQVERGQTVHGSAVAFHSYR